MEIGNFAESKKKYSEKERAQRKKFIEYLREKVKNKELEPKDDWDTIWVLSGPEISLNDEPEKGSGDNQTKERIEKGFNLLKEVAAVRLGKSVSELTIGDIRKRAPIFYYNGDKARALVFRELVDSGKIEEEYGIPSEVIEITSNASEIVHTGDQFKEFPTKFFKPKGKIIVVTSLYHTPRVQEYIKQKSIQINMPDLSDNMLIYPSNLDTLPIGRTVGEAKKIWEYF